MPKKEGEERDYKEVDPHYAKIAESILSEVNPDARQNVARVFQSDNAIRIYEILHKKGMPSRTIQKIMRESIHNIAEDEDISAGTYVQAIGEEIKGYEQYSAVIDAMYEDRILSQSKYNELKRTVHGHAKKRISGLWSDLEKLAKAAAFFFLILGVLLMIFSGFGLTGAVIGASISTSAIFVIGLAFFLLGVLLYKKRN